MRLFKYLSAFLTIMLIYSTNGATAEKKEFTASIDPDGIQRVEVIGGEYFFLPDTIIVKVNIPVEIKIKKEPSIVPHNIVIKAPEAGMDFNESLSTDPKIIRFTPVRTGPYPFYCDKKPLFLKSHREKGMEGIIKVVE